MLNGEGAKFVRKGSSSDHLLSVMCLRAEDYRTKLAQMHQIYATLKTIGPKNPEAFMQVPCNEAIKDIIRQKVLSEVSSEPFRKKVESKYVVQRTYKALSKRPDCIQKEEFSRIQEHDIRYTKLYNTDNAPKQIEEPVKTKSKAPRDLEYVVAQTNRQTLQLIQIWARVNKPGRHFKSVMIQLGSSHPSEVSFHYDRDKNIK